MPVWVEVRLQGWLPMITNSVTSAGGTYVNLAPPAGFPDAKIFDVTIHAVTSARSVGVVLKVVANGPFANGTAPVDGSSTFVIPAGVPTLLFGVELARLWGSTPTAGDFIVYQAVPAK